MLSAQCCCPIEFWGRAKVEIPRRYSWRQSWHVPVMTVRVELRECFQAHMRFSRAPIHDLSAGPGRWRTESKAWNPRHQTLTKTNLPTIDGQLLFIFVTHDSSVELEIRHKTFNFNTPSIMKRAGHRGLL